MQRRKVETVDTVATVEDDKSKEAEFKKMEMDKQYAEEKRKRLIARKRR